MRAQSGRQVSVLPALRISSAQRVGAVGLFDVVVAVLAANAAHGEPDAENDEGYGRAGQRLRRDLDTYAMQKLGEIADEADDVIGDRGDRQAFDRLLQAQLQMGALIHRG